MVRPASLQPLKRLAKFPAPLRIVCFLLILLLFWVPIAGPIAALVEDQNLESLLTMPILYLEFLALIQVWNRLLYNESQPLHRYGLRPFVGNSRNLLAGLCLGWAIVFGLFLLEGELGWVQWLPMAATLPRIIGEALLISVLLAFAEELLFRGWLFNELERDYSPSIATVVSSLIFAIAHFIRPLSELIAAWLTFPALLILGLSLAWAKRATGGQIGLPIGLHGGLVGGYYILNVGKLIHPVATVPTWLTGMNGNPLASFPGVMTLGLMAIGLRKLMQVRERSAKILKG
ncbi:lysostaphin resistance A-like protein [Alkalinema pantanalense CENA528]|uniref:CPBP family intramembrane glutamic endopeptidase n=1 Tax=Alkalinema pantanalense TaxID=1620705 RepID=UPI003D70088F